MNENEISKEVVGAALEIHKALGPGLLESVYEECMCRELSLRGLAFKRQVVVPLKYKDLKLESGLRLDLLVEELVIIEIKAVEKVMPVHKAQILSYLRLTGKKLGLLINFNEELIKNGIHRVVNGLCEPLKREK